MVSYKKSNVYATFLHNVSISLKIVEAKKIHLEKPSFKSCKCKFLARSISYGYHIFHKKCSQTLFPNPQAPKCIDPIQIYYI